MIATVRIAPVERWCEPMQKEYQRHKTLEIVGMAAAINTTSMRTGEQCVNRCRSREWMLMPSPALAIRERFGCMPDAKNVYICEHMLEMD